MKPRKLITSVLICAFLCLAVLSSCGQKTPLTLEAFRVPPAPVNLTAVQRENTVVLSWTYSGPVAIKDFIIEEKTEKGIPPEKGQKNLPFTMIGKVTASPLSLTVVFGQTYVFRVMAESETGVAGAPAIMEVPALAPPPPPLGSRFSIGKSLVTLKWEPLGKWDGRGVLYNIYEQGGGAKTKTLVNAVPTSQNTLDVAPDTGQKMVYSVTALLGGPFVYEGKSASVTIKPSDFVPARPATPAILKTAEGIRLIWEPNAESWVSGYRIYRWIKGEWRPAGFASVPSFLDAGVKSGDYRITAVGSVAESPFSEAVSIRPGSK